MSVSIKYIDIFSLSRKKGEKKRRPNNWLITLIEDPIKSKKFRLGYYIAKVVQMVMFAFEFRDPSAPNSPRSWMWPTLGGTFIEFKILLAK